MKVRKLCCLFFVFLFWLNLFATGTLFVGLEGSAPPTFTTNMAGFPNVTWTSGFSHDVSGAAAAPDGTIYIIEGAFTTHLYSFTLGSTPQQLCTISEDMSALAYANGTLYGYSNYADPKGIYSIDTTTGIATLVLDVYTGYGFRFFALDYNPQDGLFYGYTEYGASGLYSINIDTGEMIQLAGTIPASNGQGRGMAVGDNTVFLTATRGDDGIGYFAYDLSQGVGGNWVEFTNPYPNYHSTGGAAWIADQAPQIQIQGHVVGSDDPLAGLAGCEVLLIGDENYQTQTGMNGDFLFEEVDGNEVYTLEISLAGYETYSDMVQTSSTNIDLGTIVLQEVAYPPSNVVAVISDDYSEAEISWTAPNSAEELESYKVYRFLEAHSLVPALWDLLAEEIVETCFVDTDWISLPPEFYQYAVVAVYTNGIESDAILSNVLEKVEYFYPPFNLNVDADPNWNYVIFSWEAPAVTGLNGFNVYLDGVLLGFTDNTVWLIYDLINGQLFTAGVEAVYDNGVSDLVEIEFEFIGLGIGNQISPPNLSLGNYPNPFNPSTTISFNLTSLNVKTATIEIYDMKGQKVKTLTVPAAQNHIFSVVWDGTDNNNAPVSSGVYFYKLKAGNIEQTEKMILLK